MDILSRERLRTFVHDEIVYRTIRLQTSGPRDPRNTRGIVEAERQGLTLRVCTRERAFADCLDRLDLTRGLQAFAEELMDARGLDPDALVQHALDNGSRIAAARLVLLMEQNRELRRAHAAMERLARLRPLTPTVFDPAEREGGRLVPRWNAIIPEWFFEIRRNLY